MLTKSKWPNNTITLFALVVLFSLVTACANTKQDLLPSRVYLSRHACQTPGTTPYIELGINNQVKAPALAGGTVRSGDFLISLWLICDPTYNSDDAGDAQFSEVRNLALMYAYEFFGDSPEYEIKETLTINGEVIGEHAINSRSDPEKSLSHGMGGSRQEPINTENQLVARAFVAGEPVDILLTFSSSTILAEVSLRAVFEQTAEGYQLLSAEILDNTGKLP
jgi:hypothetical protein